MRISQLDQGRFRYVYGNPGAAEIEFPEALYYCRSNLFTQIVTRHPYALPAVHSERDHVASTQQSQKVDL